MTISTIDRKAAKMLRDKGYDGILTNYTCQYCGNNFDCIVRKANKTSTQVKCPNCDNFLKTWE